MIAHVNPIITFIDKRSHDGLQRQQIIIYLITTCMAAIGFPLHLLSFYGSKMPVLRALTIIALFSCLLVFFLWFFKRISLKKAFSIAAMLVQGILTTKIMYIARALPSSQNYLVVLNGVISMMIMVGLTLCYFRTASIIVGGANVATLIAAAAIIGRSVVTQSVILITLFTVFFIFMSDMLLGNVKHLQSENKQYHNEEKRLLATLRLNRKEVMTYVEMCRTENAEDKDTDRLFNMLSEKSQRNVINAVERKKAIDASRAKDISEQLPDLTPMELEVARLILRGYKLSQIAEYTGKSESNISVVRSRIRKKLGLAQGDNLREALLKLMGEGGSKK